MKDLIGIENQTGASGELVCPRAGDRVTWTVGMPSLSLRLAMSTRSGVVRGVNVDPFEGGCFDACLDNGIEVWGYLGNILTINGESVPNAASGVVLAPPGDEHSAWKKAARILGLTVA